MAYNKIRNKCSILYKLVHQSIKDSDCGIRLMLLEVYYQLKNRINTVCFLNVFDNLRLVFLNKFTHIRIVEYASDILIINLFYLWSMSLI